MTQISKSEPVVPAKITTYGPSGTVYEPSGTAYVEPIQLKVDMEEPGLVLADIGELEVNGPKPYKPVRFADHHPLEGYYDDGYNNLYNVARLVEMCKDLEPFHAP